MTTYTAITFAPVQSFIEKSRKLRDLYGSSFLLSYLAKVICKSAEDYGCEVISPATRNIVKGIPNQIIIKGNFPKIYAEEMFKSGWQTIVKKCREYIEHQLPEYQYTWQRYWKAWGNYAWEFFHAQGSLQEVEEYNRNLAEKKANIDNLPEEEREIVSLEEPLTIITYARRQLNQVKFSRNWTGINWQGESSTLSGADAIAYPRMADKSHPINNSMADQSAEIKDFYRKLSEVIGEKIIDATEYLSIPELIKRLITLDDVAKQLKLTKEESPRKKIPLKFSDLNRESDKPEDNRWTAWFQGDGDSIGQYLRKMRQSALNNAVNSDSFTSLSANTESTNTESTNIDNQNFEIETVTTAEAQSLNTFSEAMLEWGKNLENQLPPSTEIKAQRKDGKIIYAGGDDFLGVLYRNHPQEKLTHQEVLEWFYQFPQIWRQHQIPITVSVGLVFAGHSIPQRDVLQHCRETEKLAKKKGRNRLAIRLLFNSGNYLDWVCPWWFLQDVLQGYRDREKGKNWTHFYSDINTLQSRHAFSDDNYDLALSLFEIYFGTENCQKLKDNLCSLPKSDDDSQINESEYNRILGNSSDNLAPALNDWVINLAKIGFHLFPSSKSL